MNGTTAQRRYNPGTGSAPKLYWGWSPPNQRMEFMDLPGYMDSLQQGYDAAFGSLVSRAQQFGWPTPALTTSLGAPSAPAHEREHEHGTRWRRHRHRGDWDCGYERERDCGCDRHRDCGCDRDRDRGCERRDCRCDCCIEDADIIVYAHCGEVRVVPIEVANDSRKIREDVDVTVSQVRSAGGRELAWPAVIQPKGPLTLQPCSTTRLNLTVHVACECDDQPAKAATGRAGQVKAAAPADAFTALTAQRENCPDVDECEVGYTTIALGGCLIRPIVVAIAALPLACDRFRVGCGCSCCC